MPILLVITLLAVQFSLYHLGRQTAGSVARETARVARVTQDLPQARAAGEAYVAQLGSGVLEGHQIRVRLIDGGTRVEVTVTGQAMEILPLVPPVTQVVVGPVERFVEDG